MSANVYATIAERYEVPASDDDAIERFFLDVAPTLSSAERETIVAELLADRTAGTTTWTAAEVPSEVPTFSIDEAPPVARPNSLAQLVGELSAAVEKRVSDRLDTITRALDRLQESVTSETYGPPSLIIHFAAHHQVGDLVEGQTLTAIAPDWNVRTAAEWMAAHDIDAVAVVEDGRLAGIFSERDLMFRVVAKGLDPEHTSVAEVMTRELVVAEAAERVVTALKKMRATRSRHLPVVADGKLVGMISIRDLLDLDDVDDMKKQKATLLTELIANSADYES